MLCLTRKDQESVEIGEGEDMIVVKVIEIRGDKVRLGFDAPKSVPIARSELRSGGSATVQTDRKNV